MSNSVNTAQVKTNLGSKNILFFCGKLAAIQLCLTVHAIETERNDYANAKKCTAINMGTHLSPDLGIGPYFPL